LYATRAIIQSNAKGVDKGGYMALPLTTVLKTAPGLISAAADIIGMIRKSRQQVSQTDMVNMAKLDELSHLIEEQAKVLEELALNNRNLVLAVRNNRLIAVAAILCACGAILSSILWH